MRDADLTPDLVRLAKTHGFSDLQIAELRGVSEDEIRAYRHEHDVRPVFKTVDTCAAEFEAKTPYHYSSYELDLSATTEVAPADGAA